MGGTLKDDNKIEIGKQSKTVMNRGFEVVLNGV